MFAICVCDRLNVRRIADLLDFLEQFGYVDQADDPRMMLLMMIVVRGTGQQQGNSHFDLVGGEEVADEL